MQLDVVIGGIIHDCCGHVSGGAVQGISAGVITFVMLLPAGFVQGGSCLVSNGSLTGGPAIIG